MSSQGGKEKRAHLLVRGVHGRVLDAQRLAVLEVQGIGHSGRRKDDALAVLLLQPLMEHVHVQQPQKPKPQPEALSFRYYSPNPSAAVDGRTCDILSWRASIARDIINCGLALNPQLQ